MKLRAQYLQANQAWVVTFGEQLVPIGNPPQTIFPNIRILQHRLHALGLELEPLGDGRTSYLVLTKEEYTDAYLEEQRRRDVAALGICDHCGEHHGSSDPCARCDCGRGPKVSWGACSSCLAEQLPSPAEDAHLDDAGD